jgi:hypothetical protein
MPFVTGALSQIVNILKETANRLLGVLDFIAYFLGFRPTKRLRLRVVVMRDENGQPLADTIQVLAAFTEAQRVLASSAQTKVIPAQPLIVTPDDIAPEKALNVHCDFGAYQEDFGVAGAYFRRALARTIPGTLVGYGAPVTVFIVKEISGKGGCSLGPLSDYVTQEARTLRANRLMAHEVAHACGLWHSKDEANLMYPRKPAERLTVFQAAVLRNSRHITYL